MNPITKRNIVFRTAASVLAAALLVAAAPAVASDAVAVDDALDDTVIEKQITANDARRAAYGYLREQGYTRKIGPGGARVRAITRDGDTWLVKVSMSNGTSVQSVRSMLYIDAKTALVSEVPPEEQPSRVAQQ